MKVHEQDIRVIIILIIGISVILFLKNKDRIFEKKTVPTEKIDSIYTDTLDIDEIKGMDTLIYIYRTGDELTIKN